MEKQWMIPILILFACLAPAQGLECHLCSDAYTEGSCDTYGTTVTCPDDPTGYLGDPRCMMSGILGYEVFGCTYTLGCNYPVTCCDTDLCNEPGSSIETGEGGVGGSESGSESANGSGLRCYLCADLEESGVCETDMMIQPCPEDPTGLLGDPVCMTFDSAGLFIAGCSFAKGCVDGIECCETDLCNSGVSMVMNPLLMVILLISAVLIVCQA